MKKKLVRNRNVENLWGILFILPSAVGQLLFFLCPILIIIFYSVVESPINFEFVGFSNYIEIWRNKMFLLAMKNTLIFMGMGISLITICSIGIALLLNKKIFFRNIIRMCFMVPVIIPSVSILMIWNIIFNFNGALNNTIVLLGLNPVDWMNSKYARILIVAFFVWKNIGYNIILILAALQNVPKEQYEAACLDGASKFSIFKNITLINILPTVFFTVILSIINSFKIYREVFLISGNYPYNDIYMIQHYINNLFNVIDFKNLSVAAIYLILIIFIIVFIWTRIEKKLLD